MSAWLRTLPDTVGVEEMFREGQGHAGMSFFIRSEACLTLQTSRNGPLSTRRDVSILARNSPTYIR